jgi:cytochrome c biogenesis protein CcmG, thiol:disulfide interchange protein DsbE
MPARLKLTGQVLAVALVAGLLALLIWKVAHGSGKTAQPKNFTLPRLDGPGKLELASLRGKVVVLNFWASWCVPCKEEAKTFQRVWREYRGRGVVVVGIDSKDFSGDALSFAHRYGLTYPIVRDGDGSLWDPYGISFLPVTQLIDRQGKFVGKPILGGPVPPDQLRTEIDQALRA